MLAYSHSKTLRSPCIPQLNSMSTSRDRRTRLGSDVYETAARMSDTPKWRPRMARCARESSAELDRITSSTRMQMLRLRPSKRSLSCCSSNLSINGWFHSGKKKRRSQKRSIIDSITGLQAADPMKQITRSNFEDSWNRRWAIAVLLPVLRAPTVPTTNGTTLLRLSGSQGGSMLFVIYVLSFYAS